MKNKKILILFVLIVNLTVVHSQLRKIYSFPYSKNVDCVISFYMNGLYEISINKEMVETNIVSTLSYGRYVFNDNKIICLDTCNGFQLVFDYHSRYLRAEKAYSGLLDIKIPTSKFYSFNSREQQPEFVENKNDLGNNSKQIRAEYKNIQKEVLPLKSGVYEYYNYFTLYLQPNHRFRFEHYNIPLSKGEWSQQGDELILYDEDLKTFIL
jgi:hypothetical protein